jgi:hypothetical protein
MADTRSRRREVASWVDSAALDDNFDIGRNGFEFPGTIVTLLPQVALTENGHFGLSVKILFKYWSAYLPDR